MLYNDRGAFLQMEFFKATLKTVQPPFVVFQGCFKVKNKQKRKHANVQWKCMTTANWGQTLELEVLTTEGL